MGRQTEKRGETDMERRREREGDERQMERGRRGKVVEKDRRTGKEGKGRGGRERKTKGRVGATYMRR
jgi:hypothetical protein